MCRKKTKKLATNCGIPKLTVIMNMAVEGTIKEESDAHKLSKQEDEWLYEAKIGLNVASYAKDFIGVTSAWGPGEVYTCEYKKMPTLIANTVKTADLANMSLATPGMTENDTRSTEMMRGKPIVKLFFHRRLHKGDDITQVKGNELGAKAQSDRLSGDERRVKYQIWRYIPVRDLLSDAKG